MKINVANAREMARKAHESRMRNKIMRQEAERNLPQISQVTAQPAQDEYVAARILRVRRQLGMLDSLLESAKEARDIDRIASAISRLSELERVLSGRPLPGSRKPLAERRNVRSVVAPLSFD